VEPALSLAVQRALGDRSYDKRKSAALEVEAAIKALHQAKDTVRIKRVIEMLAKDFAASANPNHRKGGLIGLAATTIGLMGDASAHLDDLLPPVLYLFDDPEHRVRYYACEALYNITKVARGAILPHFNQIFSGLCKLFSDVDMDVKNGASLLDRLVKDVVTESPSFDVDNFVPLLHKYIRKSNPFIRQLLVGWISVLNNEPDINMLEWLPEFLEGLMEMLGDGNRNIRNDAHSTLNMFLEALRKRSKEGEGAGEDGLDLGPMVEILVQQCSASNKLIRHTALSWQRDFIGIGRDQLRDYFAIMLGATLNCVSDPEPDIRQMAGSANQELLEAVQETGLEAAADVLRVLQENLVSSDVSTRMACLQWIHMLLGGPTDVREQLDTFLPILLDTLKDASDDVVLLDLEVLAAICSDDAEFRRVVNQVVELFGKDPRLLEARGSVIIRRFCFLLDTTSIYMSLAEVLQENDDLEFVSLLIHTLNLILLTASELQDLREILKRSFQPEVDAEDRAVFDKIFRCWSHNPIATFALCLLAQAYDLAFLLVKRFSKIEVTVGFLMQADKLVQLLESPIFVPLRLQLLETDHPQHPSLVKALYGLLMLLPQSTAFRTLGSRLKVVGGLHTHLGYHGSDNKEKKKSEVSTDNLEELLEFFDETQAAHAAARQEQMQKRAPKRSSELPGAGDNGPEM